MSTHCNGCQRVKVNKLYKYLSYCSWSSHEGSREARSGVAACGQSTVNQPSGLHPRLDFLEPVLKKKSVPLYFSLHLSRGVSFAHSCSFSCGEFEFSRLSVILLIAFVIGSSKH